MTCVLCLIKPGILDKIVIYCIQCDDGEINLCSNRYFLIFHRKLTLLANMKKRVYGYLTVVLIMTNFIVLLFLLKMEDCEEHGDNFNLVAHGDGVNWHKDVAESSTSLTVIIRQFETFSNDLNQTVHAIEAAAPDAKTFIIADNIPYPPLKFDEKLKVRVVVTKVRPDSEVQFHISKLQQQIKTKYVLLLPDAVQLVATELQKMLHHLESYPDDMVAGRVMGETIKCLSVNVEFRNWTVTYAEKEKPLDVHHQMCDMLTGSPVLLIPKKLLFSLTHPFALPVPLALFLQTAHKNSKVMLTTDVIFKKTKDVFENEHLQWKLTELNKNRVTSLYKEFGVKKTVEVDGSVHWHGCTKESKRCFGSVLNSMPEYLYEGRWTPPCCLEALRITARHVFSVLSKCGVRYWLEGGSLLGAVRTGDIIPWDYDVDIGIYQNDVEKCIWLNQIDNSQKKPLVDEGGFIWERATEGDFYRVQYSLSNRLHVDIFPFFSREGTMTKNTWFKTHKQDCEFPEKFLQPLSTIEFVGVTASAPNNIREFLELKFGKGVIENPVYPHHLTLNNATSL